MTPQQAQEDSNYWQCTIHDFFFKLDFLPSCQIALTSHNNERFQTTQEQDNEFGTEDTGIASLCRDARRKVRVRIGGQGEW